MFRVIVHPIDGEPIIGDVEGMPADGASFILLKTPLKRNGDFIEWVNEHTMTLLLSLARVAYVEYLSPGHDIVIRYKRGRSDQDSSQA